VIISDIKVGDSIVFICQNVAATAKVVAVPSDLFRYFKVTNIRVGEFQSE